MSSEPKGSKGPGRRGRKRYVAAAAAFIAAGLIAFGSTQASRLGICSGDSCTVPAWLRMELIGFLTVVVNGARVLIARHSGRVRGTKRGCGRRRAATPARTGRGKTPRAGRRGAPPSRGLTRPDRPDATIARSAPTGIEPKPTDRRVTGPAAQPAGANRDGEETMCPALADWIARARRGGESGSGQT